jgi:hypothetical protein
MAIGGYPRRSTQNSQNPQKKLVYSASSALDVVPCGSVSQSDKLVA